MTRRLPKTGNERAIPFWHNAPRAEEFLMKAVLINDTRSGKHVGSDLVISNALREAYRAGIEITGTVLNSELASIEQKIARHSHELVLINGEGTMHDDRKRPLRIVQAARNAKDSGKKVVLFNTVWQNNLLLNDYLKYFDLIFCRETFSARAVVEAGYCATTVPDMIFATLIPKPGGATGKGTVVIDSVKPGVSTRLALLAAKRRYPFLPMSQGGYDLINSTWWIRSLLQKRSGRPLYRPGQDFISRLQESDSIISGRFHGTCLAFLFMKPVVSVASNTHKIEGLYRDIGLDASLLNPAAFLSWFRSGFIEQHLDRVRRQMDAVSAYVKSAPAKISSMFDQIGSL